MKGRQAATGEPDGFQRPISRHVSNHGVERNAPEPPRTGKPSSGPPDSVDLRVALDYSGRDSILAAVRACPSGALTRETLSDLPARAGLRLIS
jgi:hypothetical protein